MEKKKKQTEFEVVYLDDENIILEEDKRKLLPFAFFFLKYGRLITMIFASVSILTFIGGVALTISGLSQITPPQITNEGVMMQFNGDNKITTPYNPITKEYAEMIFQNRIDGTPIKNKYISVIEIIEVKEDKVLIFSDGSVVIIYGDETKTPIYIPNKNDVRIDNGKIIIEGKTVDLVDKRTLPDGTVIYEFENEKLLVEQDKEYRIINKDDIIYDNDGNILEKEIENRDYSVIDIKTVDEGKIIYFNDGSVVIIYDDKDKLPIYVPNKDDVKIDNGKIKTIGDASNTVEKDILPDGTVIYEFDNGKILVEEDDEYKIYDKDQGEEITRIEVEDDKLIYFDDGSIVIIYDDKLPEYVEDRDDVKVEDNKIKVSGEITSTENVKTLPDGTKVYEIDDKVLIENNNAYKILDKDEIEYDNKGNILYETEDINITDFTITNNDNQSLKYRVVLEETQKYNEYNKERLLPNYIYYRLSINNKVENSTLLNSNIWEIGSTIENDLKVENNTYILYEGQIDGLSTDKFKLGLWVDYETIGNDMQDKWFIGTIKVYTWTDE